MAIGKRLRASRDYKAANFTISDAVKFSWTMWKMHFNLLSNGAQIVKPPSRNRPSSFYDRGNRLELKRRNKLFKASLRFPLNHSRFATKPNYLSRSSCSKWIRACYLRSLEVVSLRKSLRRVKIGRFTHAIQVCRAAQPSAAFIASNKKSHDGCMAPLVPTNLSRST